MNQFFKEVQKPDSMTTSGQLDYLNYIYLNTRVLEIPLKLSHVTLVKSEHKTSEKYQSCNTYQGTYPEDSG
jgi:hypothetical protein